MSLRDALVSRLFLNVNQTPLAVPPPCCRMSSGDRCLRGNGMELTSSAKPARNLWLKIMEQTVPYTTAVKETQQQAALYIFARQSTAVYVCLSITIPNCTNKYNIKSKL